MSGLFRRKPPKPEPKPVELPPHVLGATGSIDGSGTIYVTDDPKLDSKKVKMLVDSLREVSSETDHDALQERMVDRAVATVGAERGLLFVSDGTGAAPLRVARAEDGTTLPSDVSFSTSVVERVLDGGASECIRVDDGGPFDPSQSMVDLNIRAAMCVPLLAGDERLGVLYVDHRASTREFTKADLRFFEAFADMLAVVWTNRRAMEERIRAERLKQDLELARSIQMNLVPARPLTVSGYTMCGRVIPADETGGDYFDFFETRDKLIAMAVGDVSGHGVGAALVMSAARAYLRSFSHTSRCPAEILAGVNRQLANDIADGLFMSMFVCLLDPTTGEFHYANGGHPGPMLLRACDGSIEDFRVTGMALAVEDEADFDVCGPIKLDPGDTVLMFSDGLNELRQGEDLYGRQRVVDSFLKHKDQTAPDLLDALFRDALRWGEPARDGHGDDITVAVLRAET